MDLPLTLEQAVSELKQMSQRRTSTTEEFKAYLLRTRLVLESLSPADIFELDVTYKNLQKGNQNA